MSDNTARRARLIELTSAVVAIAGLGVLLLSDLSLDSLTRLQQLSLLLAATVLWAVHMPVDFGGRYWSRGRASAQTQSFKNRK